MIVDKLRARYGPLLLFSLLIAALMLWSWNQWSDVLIDSGNNFYLFWQISKGKILFKDLVYYHGPFSPLLCGFIFYLFGPSLHALALVHAILLLCITHFIFRFFSYATNLLTAFVCSLFFLFVFAFSQYTGIANYNYISPYKYEAAHGIFFLFSCSYFLIKYFQKNKISSLWFAGLSLGACLLTSIDLIFAACLLGLGIAFIFWKKWKHMLIFGLGILIPSLVFFIWLLNHFSIVEAFQYTFNAIFLAVQNGRVAENPFFYHSMGMDELGKNIFLISFSFLALLTLVLLAWFLSAIVNTNRKRVLLGLFFLCLFAFLALYFPLFYWTFPKVLPLVGILVIMNFIYTYYFKKCMEPRELCLFLWALLSLSLLSKMMFFARIEHYGFYLAMPALLLLIAVMFFIVPHYFQRYGRNTGALRVISFALFFSLGSFYFFYSSYIYRHKTYPVGEGVNTIVGWNPAVDSRDYDTNLAIQWISAHTSPSSTLLTVPEGSILNYLAFRERPDSYTLNIVELLTRGEDRILEGWRRATPDYVALVHRDSREFGLPPFGSSEAYGKKTLEWVDQNYDPVKLFGSPPFQTEKFGILLLRKKERLP